MRKDLRIVGIFRGKYCEILINGNRMGSFTDLHYTGVGTDLDDMRLYTNNKDYVWLDYAVYE